MTTNGIQLSIDEAVNTLKVGVRRVGAFLGVGTHAAANATADTVVLADTETNIRLFPSPVPEAVVEEVKTEFRLWIEACAFRELCEVLEVYLTQLYSFASFMRASTDGRIPSGFQLVIPNAFDRRGLTAKLKTLEDDFAISSRYSNFLGTLWDARNCLVHRRGYVGAQDLNDGDRLTIRWIGLTTKFIENGTEIEYVLRHDVELPDTRAGGQIVAVVDERSRSFPVGERIQLTAHDLAEICWFCLTQSDELIQGLLRYSETRGVPVVLLPDAPEGGVVPPAAAG